MLAYLVIRDGAKWTDVFRLIPGQTVTVGRANTNQIVLKDERCSRYHAEIFLAQGRWVVRDLDSRNGTLVDNHPIRGDFVLSPGEVVRIGRSQLAFVHDLAKAFPDSSSLIVKEFKADYQEPTIAAVETQPLPAPEAWTILSKRDQTSLFDAADPSAPSPDRDRIAARLARLQAELHSANEPAALRDAALDSLVQFLDWEGGSIHLLSSEGAAAPAPNDLELAVARTAPGKNLVSCPAPLVRQAFGERAALLVRFGDIKPFAEPSTAGPAKRLGIVSPIGRG
ncbi:MAG TPA: FHA domain-containing protein, partial [Pirellulales bacterium]